MAQLLKIDFEGTLRRVTVPIQRDKPNAGLTFSDLEAKARDLFSIPSCASICITYIDAEGDIVTMANDDEYRDACISQALNPLKLKVRIVGSTELVQYEDPSSLPMSENKEEGFLMRLWPPSRFLALVFKKWVSFGRTKTHQPAIHHGVRCDYCRTTPIQGPRYSSINTPDYDLCTMCFMEIGDEISYNKIDSPIMTHILESGMDCSHGKSLADGDKIAATRPFRSFDSKLLQGLIYHQIVAPGSNISQVWHMQNIGALPWPQQTKLVPIGNNTLGDDLRIDLDLPEGGLPCGAEFYVYIDIAAPKEVGQYAGTWSLVTPTDIIFGERPLMVIDVVNQWEEQSASMHNKLSEGEHVHESKKTRRNEIQTKQTTVKRSLSASSFFSSTFNDPIGNGTSCRDPASKRELDTDFQMESDDASTLEKTDTNLQYTVDNLVFIAGWDQMLQELQAMGFHDMSLNRCVLLINKGSIKHAVKDLVDMEKSGLFKVKEV